jgi:DNA helicase IV
LIQQTRAPTRPTRFRVGLRTVSVEPADIARVLAAAHSSPAPYRERRDRFAVLLADHVMAAAGGGSVLGAEAGELMRSLSADRGFRSLLDRVWPPARPADVVRSVLRDPSRAAEEVLSKEEQGLLSSSGSGPDRWSAADAALIDEAQSLIAGTARTYGHAIVDEAQDYSPMQLRMIARRAPSGSITVLGDVAQATGLWPHTTWEEVLEHLPRGGQAQIEELTIGYRVPRQILELAGRLLPLIAPDLRAPVPIRDGEAPEFLAVPQGTIVRALLKEMDQGMSRLGTLGVIVPDAMLDDLLVRARANGIEVDAAGWGRGRKITVLTPRQAKGLEFDHVVLADPSEIVSRAPDGYRQLYVSLTRATQTLKVFHTGALPPELRWDERVRAPLS